MTVIYRRELYVPSTGSSYKVISAEAYSKHGLNLNGAIVDELHAHENRELLDVLSTSMGARRQPLHVHHHDGGPRPYISLLAAP